MRDLPRDVNNYALTRKLSLVNDVSAPSVISSP